MKKYQVFYIYKTKKLMPRRYSFIVKGLENITPAMKKFLQNKKKTPLFTFYKEI